MENKAPRVLFVLKYREQTWGDYSLPPCDNYSAPSSPHGYGLSSGLLNSATFVKDMLEDHNIAAKLVQVVDNNQIDREVKEYQPTHVIIEALWVVPDKFDILTKLHPKVKWIIRNHSEIPFVSNEGIAMEWLLAYVGKPNVYISNNAPRAQKEMKALVTAAYPEMLEGEIEDKIIYLPNYYPVKKHHVTPKKVEYKDGKRIFDVGCFGAIRPLKNHLEQAVAAIMFAQDMGFYLRFHINATRIEGNGSPILKNLQKLFERMSHCAELVEHGWAPHDKFMELVEQMDMGLQVSFSETFNIVAADFVQSHVPVVGSSEIAWLFSWFCADPTSSAEIVNRMKFVYNCDRLIGFDFNRYKLKKYVAESRRIWVNHFLHDC
jgi:hypothetical protein